MWFGRHRETENEELVTKQGVALLFVWVKGRHLSGLLTAFRSLTEHYGATGSLWGTHPSDKLLSCPVSQPSPFRCDLSLSSLGAELDF